MVQPTTDIMDIAILQKKYGEKLNFCGSMCVQSTLAFGTPDEIKTEVERRLDLFPQGGLFLGPTHAIQVGSPIENILSLYRSAGSLKEIVDDDIKNAKPVKIESGVNMSKLF